MRRPGARRGRPRRARPAAVRPSDDGRRRGRVPRLGGRASARSRSSAPRPRGRAARRRAPAQCVEVMTGAVLPAAPIRVVPIERVRAKVPSATSRDPRSKPRSSSIGAAATGAGRLFSARHALRSARDRRAGRRRPRDRVGRGLPRVAVISTGDELVEAGKPIARAPNPLDERPRARSQPDQHRLGRVTRARLRDDANALAVAIDRLDTELDVLVLSGGVSMGQFDFVPSVLTELGAKLVLQRSSSGRDGRCGSASARAASRSSRCRAIPFRRSSARRATCCRRCGTPRPRAGAAGARRAHGADRSVADADAVHARHAIVVGARHAARRAAPTNTSGDFVTLAGTDGFVELAAKRGSYPPGTVARLFRW